MNSSDHFALIIYLIIYGIPALIISFIVFVIWAQISASKDKNIPKLKFEDIKKKSWTK